MPDHDPPKTFTAWLRGPGRLTWKPQCRCATEGEAWTELLAAGKPGDKCVLPSGQDPNQPQAAR